MELGWNLSIMGNNAVNQAGKSEDIQKMNVECNGFQLDFLQISY